MVVCKNLNSSEAYVIVDEEAKKAFAWSGEGASEDEKAYGPKLAKILAPDLELVEYTEGKEDDSFWNSFDGGKTEYATMKALGYAPGFDPRLFQISNSSGYIHMKELYNFQQEDLSINDVMILDSYSTIFVWVGKGANNIEKKNAAKKVETYIASLVDGRKENDVQIVEVEPCGEPPAFTTQFPEWEDEIAAQWLQDDPYTAQQKKIAAEREALYAAKKAEYNADDADYKDPSFAKFSLDELKAGTPEGVNPKKKEYYLSDDDFKAVLGMEMDAWEALKDWKRKDAKKKAGLF